MRRKVFDENVEIGNLYIFAHILTMVGFLLAWLSMGRIIYLLIAHVYFTEGAPFPPVELVRLLVGKDILLFCWLVYAGFMLAPIEWVFEFAKNPAEFSVAKGDRTLRSRLVYWAISLLAFPGFSWMALWRLEHDKEFLILQIIQEHLWEYAWIPLVSVPFSLIFLSIIFFYKKWMLPRTNTS